MSTIYTASMSSYIRFICGSNNKCNIIIKKKHPEGYYYYNIDLYVFGSCAITQQSTIQKIIRITCFFLFFRGASHTPYSFGSCDDITVHR